MTAYDKQGRAISQCVKILCNGKEYTSEQLREILKQHEEIKEAEEKFKKSGVLLP